MVVEFYTDACFSFYPNGACVPAAPEDSDKYRATAESVGYGGDTARLCLEHELIHHALSDWLGIRSPTLERVSQGQTDPTWINQCEEEAVLAVQRFANAAGISLWDTVGQRHLADMAPRESYFPI